MPTPPWSKRSLAVQAMGAVEPVTKAVVPPIHLATTFIRDEDNAYSSGFVYGRPDNATVRQAESVLAMLEDGPEALLFASGMAAATAVFQALDPGDHVVAPRVMYWALRSWLATEAQALGLARRLRRDRRSRGARGGGAAGRDQARLDRDAGEPALDHHRHRRRGRDRASRRRPARRSIRPPPRRCIRARWRSAPTSSCMPRRRYLNGHSDVVAGALVTARQDAFWARVVTIRKGQGAILGPFEAYLLMRGLRTLHLRAAAQAESAQTLALRLSAHPHVARVLYPGLPQHPATTSRRARWRAASAPCCRSRSRAASAPRSRPPHG